MKYIIAALAFCMTCFGQEKMHLTAYRLIDEVVDGPCSIKGYVKYLPNFGSYVTAESDDQELINTLLDIKNKAKRGKSREFYCEERTLAGETIHQMFVISGGVTDTLYIDKGNKWIIFPDQRKAYLDKDKKVKKAFIGIMKEFIEYDFQAAIRAEYYVDERDSISTGALSYKGRSAISFLNNFKANAENYLLVRTDSAYGDIKEIFVRGTDSITFCKRKIEITLSDPDTGWLIDIIKPGDSENKLVEKFPASTRVKMIYLMRFEDIKRMYYYKVTLKNNKGSIAYFIKDNKIDRIKVYID
ncbi:MAG: hypothetical protein V4581_06470 [Bacteroidota bacterium]